MTPKLLLLTARQAAAFRKIEGAPAEGVPFDLDGRAVIWREAAKTPPVIPLAQREPVFLNRAQRRARDAQARRRG